MDLLGVKAPEMNTATVLPQDAGFFMSEIVAAPGKPMPFVPRIDRHVFKSYLSDALFYCHDPRYDADSVLMLPGPRALTRLETKDRPVAQILQEFVPKGTSLSTVQEPVIHAARVKLENGTRVSNPVRALTSGLTMQKDDAGNISWKDEHNHTRARMSSDGSTVVFKYTLYDARSQSHEVPFLFETKGNSVVWHKNRTDEVLSDVYHSVFRSPDSEKFRTLFGYPAAGGPDPLTLHAARALPLMTDTLSAHGLVHYVSRIDALNASSDSGALEGDPEVTDVTDGAVRVLLGDGTVVEGEFRRGPGHLVQPLPLRKRSGEPAYFDSPVKIGEISEIMPENMHDFAEAGGDGNPIHADDGFARLSGLPGAIVHGLYLQGMSEKKVKSLLEPARRVTHLETRFMAPVSLGSQVELVIERSGRNAGRHLVEVSVRSASQPVAQSILEISAPSTAYVFPGQGVQKQGMHEPAFSRSDAAREIWERADAITREKFGFSIIEVVRDNPKELRVGEDIFRHPDGVIHLTQFTQPALVINAMALTAELRESGALVPDAAFSGHSLGEYAALSGISGILSLDTVVEVVYHRGLTMQNYVPRDEKGQSPYRMAVVRPHHAGITDSEIRTLIEGIRQRTGMPLEIVNYNVRGRQYAVTGRIEALEELKKALPSGRRSAYLEIPGLDVPFHSTILRGGVDAFRKTLLRTIPEEVDPAILEGRYWPNLTGEPFELSERYVDLVEALTDSPFTKKIRALANGSPADRRKAASMLLTELLAYQFASPVQWIRIQEGFIETGYEHVIEIGPEHQPTLRNLMLQTLTMEKPATAPMVLHYEMDRDTVMGMSLSDGVFSAERVIALRAEKRKPSPSDVHSQNEMQPESPLDPAQAVHDSTSSQISAPTVSQSETEAQNPVSLGLRTLLAYLGGFWPKELQPSVTIEDLIQGNSARRNQILADLRREFGTRLAEDVTKKPLSQLEQELSRTVTYTFPGPVLSGAADDLRARLGMPAQSAVKYLHSRFAVTDPAARAVVYSLLPYVKFNRSRLTGGDNPFGQLSGRELLDEAASEGLGLKGRALRRSENPSSTSADPNALAAASATLVGRDGILTKMARTLAQELDPDSPPLGMKQADCIPSREPSVAGSGIFDPDRIVSFTDASNWIREDTIRAVYARMRGEDDEASLSKMVRRGYDADLLMDAGSTGEEVLKMVTERKKAYTTDTAVSVPVAFSEYHTGNTLDLSVQDTPCVKAAIITGAGPDSIAEALMRRLLNLGMTVVAGSSRLDYGRVERYAEIFRHEAAQGARLFVAPFDQGSYGDIDAFSAWSAEILSDIEGPVALLPFGAMAADGMVQDFEERHEKAIRVNLLGVERLVGSIASRMSVHVILPMSPNEGAMGGDGIYGESKAALRALLGKGLSEPVLRQNASMVGAVIGWVRGTGLMERQDSLAPAVERELGIKTFSTAQMASLIVSLMSSSVMAAARNAPVTADLTGGISRIADWGVRVARLRAATDIRIPPKNTSETGSLIRYPRVYIPARGQSHTSIDPKRIPVVVGYGEIGPYGESEARWSRELKGSIGGFASVQLALIMGLVRYDSSNGRLVDSDTGKPVTEAQIPLRYRERITSGTGIRLRPSKGENPERYQSLTWLTLNETVLVSVPDMKTARAMRAQDPQHIQIFQENDGQITVRLRKGATIAAPHEEKLRNPVSGMLPDGWDFSKFGLTEAQIQDMDRNALMMLVATALAFENAGTTPEEIVAHLGAWRVGNALGSGIGGIKNMERLYTDPLLGYRREPTSLQESLGNVPGAHVSQGYLGNFGPIVSPVAACATAGVSLELAVEKILLGKADFMVAGSTDDIGYAGSVGFDDMGATVDWPAMEKAGIPPHAVSRPHDVRRRGFVEAQGGGALLVTTLDVAVRLGLPVYAAVIGAWTHTDGYSRSVPAPGYGLLYTVLGGRNSPLGQALAGFGFSGDDIDVVSMHGTSTAANDPHEAILYEKILTRLGKTLPALAVSQKAVTGHPKGGAAAYQVAGIIQMFRDSVVPGHMNLHELDPAERRLGKVVFPAEPVHLPQGRPRVALATTLGFGHVGSLLALANPESVMGTVERSAYDTWAQEVRRRLDPARAMKRILGLSPLLKIAAMDSEEPEV